MVKFKNMEYDSFLSGLRGHTLSIAVGLGTIAVPETLDELGRMLTEGPGDHESSFIRASDFASPVTPLDRYGTVTQVSRPSGINTFSSIHMSNTDFRTQIIQL